MSKTYRLLLVDDHPILRTGLASLLELEPDFEVVGQASTGEDALERVAALKPDIVIMDLDMPGIGGLEATRRITAGEGAPRVLILTSHREADSLMPVLEAGASGYVEKTNAEADLVTALRTVARGEVFLYPTATKLLLRGFRTAEARGEVNPLEELSEREREVLTMTAEGYSATEIGKKLFLSPKTVETYRARLMQKLGFHHRHELVRFALRTGALKADPD